MTGWPQMASFFPPHLPRTLLLSRELQFFLPDRVLLLASLVVTSSWCLLYVLYSRSFHSESIQRWSTCLEPQRYLINRVTTGLPKARMATLYCRNIKVKRVTQMSNVLMALFPTRNKVCPQKKHCIPHNAVLLTSSITTAYIRDIRSWSGRARRLYDVSTVYARDWVYDVC